MKKHTRKISCQFCGANCGSVHQSNCIGLKALEKQGRGYKIPYTIEEFECQVCGNVIKIERDKNDKIIKKDCSNCNN